MGFINQLITGEIYILHEETLVFFFLRNLRPAEFHWLVDEKWHIEFVDLLIKHGEFP